MKGRNKGDEEGDESESKEERIKDECGEEVTGNHRGKIDRGETKWNKVNKFCSLECCLVTNKEEITSVEYKAEKAHAQTRRTHIQYVVRKQTDSCS